MIIAALAKTRERFMGIGQILTMPLFFTSDALYLISVMPILLQVISYGNPLSYGVNALRSFLLRENLNGICLISFC
jgi:ABC-2 type transport system permease protein